MSSTPNHPQVHTYSSAGNGHLHLATSRRHDGAELLADAAEEAKSVVLSQGLEEVLDSVVLGTSLLGELLNNSRLVSVGQGRGRQNGRQLRIALDELAELGEGAGSGIEARGLDGGRVLN